MQLDRGTLGLEPEAGLALLVGGNAVVGDEGAYCGRNGTALPGWTVFPILARLPSPVQPFQTAVCNVMTRRKGEPERELN